MIQEYKAMKDKEQASFLAHSFIEDFVCGLEDLLKYAQECLEEDERDEETKLTEKSALENMKMLLWKSEQLAAENY